MSDKRKKTTQHLDELAKLGRDLIGMQLTLASKEPKEALNELWVVGYCFGIFDAIAQRAKLDQYPEGIALITIGFELLLSGPLEGAAKVRQALDNQTDPDFARGNRTAGTDLFAWFADTNKAPMSLFNQLTN